MDQKVRKAIVGAVRKEPFARALNMELVLSLIHISEPTRPTT